MIHAGSVTWPEARSLAEHVLRLHPDREDLGWAKACWGALEHAGLTVYRSKEEEHRALSMVPTLGLVYAEFGQACGLMQVHDSVPEVLAKCTLEQTREEAQERFSAVLEALRIHAGADEMFELTLRSWAHGLDSVGAHQAAEAAILSHLRYRYERPAPDFPFSSGLAIFEQCPGLDETMVGAHLDVLACKLDVVWSKPRKASPSG